MKNIALLLFPVLLILFACKAPQINEFDNGEIESPEEAWEEEEYYDDLYDFSDEEDAPKVREIYNPSNTILTDLVHTKLEVSFNWNESQLNGKATITAKPHFYESDKLILDAKGMDVLKVQMNGADLNYTYNDALKLNIDLGRTYKSTEQYTISIEYVSKPDELEMGGSSAITGDKGLYFINPKGEEKNKMPQIWTQGETQANSVWFPTIDSPNAKTTQEIYITVEDKYVTLSNGDLVSSKKNKDGTRTDYWKQDLPHAPYLFMMAIGEYSIVKDSYTKKDGSKIEVNYYVEPEHKEDARGIFGETPNMIGYFSELLDLEYPWDKYNQVVVRDYVSGAMENTGAVIFGEYVYKDKEDLLDGNDQSTIAHELFHHWFGDLVTCESWANLPLNESFANYSQYLWDEYRYGMDEADYQAEMEADGYFQSASYQGYHDLIWFDHFDKEDMFDGHSYNKGGRILHMLRSYLGDEAFFKGLNNYLTTNKYKAAEFHHLRLAFEEVSGEDLNWFFNQWFLGKGHLILFTDYEVTDDQTILFKVKQRQNIEDFPIYKIPTQVLIWSGDEVVVHDIVIDELEQEFELSYSGEIKNIQIDPKQDLLAKIYEEKSADQFRHQFYNSKAYKSRMVGLRRASKSNTLETQNLLSDALDDPFWNIRIEAASIAYQLGCSDHDDIANKMLNLAKNDSISKVRAEMIQMLDKSGEEEATLLTLFKQMVSNDPSSNVRSSAFQALVDLNPSQALSEARLMEDGASLSLKITLAEAYSKMGEAQEQAFFEDLIYNGGASGEDEMRVLFSYLTYALMQDIDLVQKMPKILAYYKENGGGYVAMYYDRIIAYSIEQCQEIINALVIEENVTESDQLLQVVSDLEKLSEE